jgi:hypothetical protein
MQGKEINTVWRLMQVLATFKPDMQVMIAPNGAVGAVDMGWIENVGAEKHEGEWFAVIHVAD